MPVNFNLSFKVVQAVVNLADYLLLTFLEELHLSRSDMRQEYTCYPDYNNKEIFMWDLNA